jgi:hypothetical protein
MTTLKEQPTLVLEINVYDEFQVNPEDKKVEYVFVMPNETESIEYQLSESYFLTGTWTRAPQDFFNMLIFKATY